jgi:flagellar hook-associated protein 3 FlgL
MTIDVLTQGMYAAMKNGDSSEITKAGALIENDLQICLDAMADIGGRMNRLDLTKNRVETSLANIEESLSINEDVDYAEAATNLASSKTVYESALAAGAKTLSISLMNYI